ncbi:cell surface protein [Lactiplantibacillus plantarum]|uniref:WxL domain-containing protein n=1 Tax=Lactiplantibacillus plantarum TaxID=1590 RepID=UPI000F8E8377|nr:WxL domain-containing protein [Lactiplantibacillus plantarum]RUS41263.1 cell surface protein [Lactiplantibacillus plantarum]
MVVEEKQNAGKTIDLLLRGGVRLMGRYIKFLVRCGLSFLFVIWLTGKIGYASLSTAPAGMNQLDKVFTLPSTFANGITNSASIKKATNAAAPNTEAIEITNGANQLGGFWSNETNKLDLAKDATFKMWLYLGSKSTVGDGIAFVMHNDPNGVKAASTFTNKNIIGETLGVWAVDDDNQRASSTTLAKTAIQNSWALEFDNNSNNSTTYNAAGSGNSFDVGLDSQHLTSGYPGLASQYTAVKVNLLLLSRYYFKQKHESAQTITGLNLTDGNWHQLTLEWKASNKTMTFDYDKTWKQTEYVDTAKLNSTDGKVYWGFTGANGNNAGNNYVVFESLPNMVDANANAKVTDTTKGTEIASGDKIKAKDHLKYEYTLKYNGGQQDWSNIKAVLKLPNHVTFNTANVTYSDGMTQTVDIKDINDGQLSFSLNESLSLSNAEATITLEGSADDVETNSDTTETASTFKGDNYETTATTPNYTITMAKSLELSVTNGLSQTISKGDNASISGEIKGTDAEQLNNDNVTVYGILNDTDLDAIKPIVDEGSSTGTFLVNLSADQLKLGENIITLYAKDGEDNASEKVTVKITVTGELSFGSVATTSYFQTVHLTGKTQTVGRGDGWVLSILDERGTGSGWQLAAKTEGFTDKQGVRVRGNLIYKNQDSRVVINNSDTVIDSHKSNSNSDSYNVVSNWGDDSGLLFETNAGAIPGTYKGIIVWTLSDAPE